MFNGQWVPQGATGVDKNNVLPNATVHVSFVAHNRCNVWLVSYALLHLPTDPHPITAKCCEVLETNGVPVVSYGSDDFPAFFSPSSGVRSPLRLDTPMEVAAAAKV